MSRIKKIGAIGASVAAIGTGIGLWSEIEGNQDAKGRVITIDTCERVHSSEQKIITKIMEECVEVGVPGGEPLGEKVNTGNPAEFLQSARMHEVDRSHFSVERVAAYTVGAPLALGACVLFSLAFGGSTRESHQP